MSAFSDTLSQFIDDKKIKVYSMAKYCDTDRSTMYKFISGKRNPPSDEIIKKMAQFMHLSPMEWQKLKESWDVARIGADAYYKRKVWKVLSAIFRISLLQNSAAVLLLRMLLMQKTGPTVFH